VSTVVGIFPDGSKLQSLIDGLKSSGADVGNLRILWSDEVPTELASSGAQFVWIGDVQKGAPAGIITGSGNIGVPGLSGTSIEPMEGDELLESLSDLGIPDGRTDDYARAVEDGRVVVGYPRSTDAGIRQLFSASGATIVEEF